MLFYFIFYFGGLCFIHGYQPPSCPPGAGRRSGGREGHRLPGGGRLSAALCRCPSECGGDAAHVQLTFLGPVLHIPDFLECPLLPLHHPIHWPVCSADWAAWICGSSPCKSSFLWLPSCLGHTRIEVIHWNFCQVGGWWWPLASPAAAFGVHSAWPGVLSAGGTAWSWWAGGRAHPAPSQQHCFNRRSIWHWG